MQPFDHWNTWKDVASQSFGFSFASVNPDGTPRVTPIGSLILSKDEPKGLYFQIFTSKMTRNLERNNRVCILATNSSKWFLLRSFLSRKFKTPPGVRLSGMVGEKRIATEDEIQSLKESLGLLGRFLKTGPEGLNIKYVRENHFDSAKPVYVGKLTKGLFE
ncbi:pyridoxamine 5'-phosphate oxidase family protein [Bacillus sp. FJAT-49705]|uniref:Pyridoxamine 5'-phosphate oxidase family protein n=1 Tax=Cytobacillus citreus TaxID=2833586 RepID=A0ABS5NRB9_9BACI|nr:pyridoxamine 5'-phosphate oxidase family protein [Cytobacillus citreus]MBS4189678.1 pyridoxamine 5'-phosphate oxidase family protein [Cytobacillus citreus]